MKLSQIAWNNIENIYQDIIKHPFNIELANGSLEQNRFNYYIQQDIYYLSIYCKCLSIIAAKINNKYTKDFLKFAQDISDVETHIVHSYFAEQFSISTKKVELSLATLAYTSYLLQIAYAQPVEVALASILPCFWVYNKVGLEIIKTSTPNNKYKQWIDMYSSDDFGNSVNFVIDIFNEMAEQASQKIKDAMLESFKYSTILEYHFWDQSYNMKNIY